MASPASPYVSGLIAAYFLSRHGLRRSYARSATPQNPALGLRLRTAHEHGGLTDVAACSAGKRTATRNERMDGPGHGNAFQPRCASGSRMRSTLASRSGRYSVV